MIRPALIVCAVVGLFAAPAFAQPPKTFELPATVVVSMLNYLAARPYAEVHSMIGAVQGCIAMQVPGDDGVVMDRGQCPDVSAAIQARSAKPAPPTGP